MCGSFLNTQKEKNMDEKYMRLAIKEAQKAAIKDEVPIGAIIVHEDKVIARAYNLRESRKQSIAHAEILAIQKACKKLDSWRLENCTIYVTLEPCPMCAGAILQSRISRVVYGAKDAKGGCVDSCLKMYETAGFNHYPTWTSGVLADECAQLLKDFFKNKRIQNKNKAKAE